MIISDVDIISDIDHLEWSREQQQVHMLAAVCEQQKPAARRVHK